MVQHHHRFSPQAAWPQCLSATLKILTVPRTRVRPEVSTAVELDSGGARKVNALPTIGV